MSELSNGGDLLPPFPNKHTTPRRSLVGSGLVLVLVAALVLGAWLLSVGTEPVAATVDGVSIPEATLEVNLNALAGWDSTSPQGTEAASASLAQCVASQLDPAVAALQGTAADGAGQGTVKTSVAQGELGVLVSAAWDRHLLALHHDPVQPADIQSASSSLAQQIASSCPVSSGSNSLFGLPAAFVTNEVSSLAAQQKFSSFLRSHPEEAAVLTSPDQYCLFAILVGTEAQAQALHDAIDKGASFVELARQQSIDQSASSGGLLGCASAGQLQQEVQSQNPSALVFAQQLAQLGRPGTVGEPQPEQTSSGGPPQWAVLEYTVGTLEPKVSVDPRFGSFDPANLDFALPPSPSPSTLLNPGANQSSESSTFSFSGNGG